MLGKKHCTLVVTILKLECENVTILIMGILDFYKSPNN